MIRHGGRLFFERLISTRRSGLFKLLLNLLAFDFRIWHFSDVASAVSDVRSAGAKQALRLRVSRTEFNPKRTRADRSQRS
jgi:hypothetical protein